MGLLSSHAYDLSPHMTCVCGWRWGWFVRVGLGDGGGVCGWAFLQEQLLLFSLSSTGILRFP